MNTSIVSVSLLLATGPALGWGEGLAEAAKREKERRAKLQAADVPSKTYDEEELQKAVGSTYNQVEGPPLTQGMLPASRSSSPQRSRTGLPVATPEGPMPGDYERNLEKRIGELEARRAKLPPGPFGPSMGACQEGAYVSSGPIGHGAIELRDAPKVKICDPQVKAEQEAQKVQAELDATRAELAERRRPKR